MAYEEYDGEVLPLTPEKDIDSIVSAITRVESGGNTEARSSQGARGSMQIMPATFKQYAKAGEDYENDIDRRAAAIRKIRSDYAYYDGDVSKTAAAYIGGRGAIRKDGTIRDDVKDALGTTPVKYASMVAGRMGKSDDYEEYKGEVLPIDKYEEYTGEVLPLPNSSTSIIGGSFKDVPKQSTIDKLKSFYSGSKANVVEPDSVSYDAAGNVQGIASKDESPKDGRAVDERRTQSAGRLTDKDIPDATAKSIAQDALAGVFQIVPTALKGVGDLTRMATGDTYGKGLSDFSEKTNKAVQDKYGSERGALQRKRFEQDRIDPAMDAADLIFGNKGALSDQMLPTVGSMALPMGAATAAGKLAQAGKAAKLAMAIDAETVLARANAAREAATIGTTVAQNSSGTYSDIRDKGGDQGQSYLGASISAPFSYVAGRLTGGGAEAQASKLLAGSVKGSLASIPKGMFREGTQEIGEEAGQYLGETIGTGSEFDANAASKRLAVAGTLGAVMGGGIDTLGAARQSINDRIQTPKPTPADIVAPTVKTFDEAIALAKESISKPVGSDIGDVIAAYKDKSVSADEQLISQIRATAPAETIAEQAMNTPATPIIEAQNAPQTQAQAVETRAPERIEPAGQPTTNATARTDPLETTGINDANTVQTPNGAAPNPNNLPATAVSAVTGDRRLPADRLEPALQPEPKMVQGVPEAVQNVAPIEPAQNAPQARADLTEPQRQQVNAANEQQLEDLYQQDVKDAINQRLGRADLVKEKPKLSQFKSFLRQHGVHSSLANDIVGERGLKANNALPATFRKNGMQLDALVERAVEAGFMTQSEVDSDNDNGGINRLTDLIQREIRGERHAPADYNEENAQAKHEASQRAEIESMADKLRLPYAGDISTDQLASMVKRVNDRLEAENLKSWGETKDGKPLGKLKEERVLQQAKEFAARIERKRVQYERNLDEFAAVNIKVQDAVLEVLYNADGNPIIMRQADIQSDAAWNELNGQWEGQNGQTNTPADGTAQEASAPDNEGARTSVENPSQNSTEPQQGRDAEEGLTAPTREDVLAQQERADNVEALDAKKQIDREASGQTLTSQVIETRSDSTGEMFGESLAEAQAKKAQAELDKKNTGKQKEVDPNQGSMFDEPADRPSSDALRTEADIEKAADKLRDDAEAAYLAKSDTETTYSAKELTAAGDVTITVQTDTGNAKMTLNAKKYLAALDERAEALNEVKRCLG